jgi:hypothetical protein
MKAKLLTLLLWMMTVCFTFSANASLTNPDLDIDIDNADMDRVEGWIKEFPTDIRKELEVLLTSEALRLTTEQLLGQITDSFQCIGSSLKIAGKEVLSDTKLANNNYSDQCIKAIGEEPPGVFNFLNRGRNYNIDQRFKLEKCELARFAKRNGGRPDFVSNMKSKAQTVKSLGYAAKCSDQDVDDGDLMFLEGSDYFNVWNDLKVMAATCTSLGDCYSSSLEKTKGILNIKASCPLVQGDSLVADVDLIETRIAAATGDMLERSNQEHEIYNWAIYELYNVRRSLLLQNKKWNDKVLNSMHRFCSKWDQPPKDSPSITTFTSDFVNGPHTKDAIAEAMEESPLCINEGLATFNSSHYSVLDYSKLNNQVVNSPCDSGYNTTITDCSGHTKQVRVIIPVAGSPGDCPKVFR